MFLSRKTLLPLTLLSCFACSSLGVLYHQQLSARIIEIENLQRFDDCYIMGHDSTGYGRIWWNTNTHWRPDLDFYVDDIVIDDKGQLYRAIEENTEKIPRENPNQWLHMPYRHPYFFFRDSATTNDLRKLLSHKHRYVKMCAFGALANRNSGGLFPIILEALSDTTKMDILAGDAGYDGYLADRLIAYEVEHLTDKQKAQLKTMIETKHRHLVSSFILLSGGYPTLNPVWPK